MVLNWDTIKSLLELSTCENHVNTSILNGIDMKKDLS